MTAERLREAATLMRQRAREALETDEAPWAASQMPEPLPGAIADCDWQVNAAPSDGWTVAEGAAEGAAEHIASWHPLVALAVADLLDRAADVEDYDPGHDGFVTALAVADAYLGGRP